MFVLGGVAGFGEAIEGEETPYHKSVEAVSRAKIAEAKAAKRKGVVWADVIDVSECLVFGVDV
jgi:hypothetical protein